MKKINLYFLLLSVIFVCGCSRKADYNQINFFAMDTFCVISAQNADDALLQEAKKAVENTENLMSRTNPESEIYALNNVGFCELSRETEYVLKKAVELAEKTNEAFSPALGSLTSLWNITSDNPRVPDETEIKKALLKCDYKNIVFENQKAVVSDVRLDLGGIAKGYAAQIAIESLKNNGVQNALVSLGGNVAVCGSSQNSVENGSVGWKVGIRNPFDTDSVLGYVVMTEGVCAVSGDYERFFVEDGIKYHHIFDRFTGFPAQSSLSSVAVISQDGALADALTTAFFVMGEEKAREFYEEEIYSFEAVFVDNNGNVSTTDNIEFFQY